MQILFFTTLALGLVYFFYLNRRYRKLKASFDLLNSYLESAPIGMAIYDKQFRFVKVNTSLAEINGVELSRHTGHTVAELIPSVWAEVGPDFERILQTGESVKREVSANLPAGVGEPRHWLCGFFPVRNQKQEVAGIGACVSEITQLKRTSALLKRKEEELTALSQELAESNTELERFAYIASHDFKDPLRGISTYLGLIAKECGDRFSEKERGYFKTVVDSAKRLHHLVDALLQMGRATHGKLEIKSVSFAQILENAKHSLHGAITDSQAEIESSVESSINGDPHQLTQLVQNLLSNAIKFRKQAAPPKIRISQICTSRGVEFLISDNGIGIAEKDKDKIFEMFHRIHPRNEFPGEGIGLAACRKIVNSHGGRIWVESKLDQGSTFHFTLVESSHT